MDRRVLRGHKYIRKNAVAMLRAALQAAEDPGLVGGPTADEWTGPPDWMRGDRPRKKVAPKPKKKPVVMAPLKPEPQPGQGLIPHIRLEKWERRWPAEEMEEMIADVLEDFGDGRWPELEL